MKTLVIENYIQGLASFLDESNIEWECMGLDDKIKIHYKNDYELFLIAYNFGRFYENNSLKNPHFLALAL